MTRVPTPSGVIDWRLDDTPFAVVDVETTGLYRSDRIVEIAIVRCEPGIPPKLVLSTLVDPERTVDATYIHGIATGDVIGAPTFRELSVDVARALAGCVVAGYNSYFDVRFLRDEFKRVNLTFGPPFVCLLNLGALMGLFGRCSLTEACASLGILHCSAHSASSDAMASAAIWHRCRERLNEKEFHTFRDLWGRCHYAFTQSFASEPMRAAKQGDEKVKRKLIDPSLRSQRIGDLQRSIDVRQEVRHLFAAREEMDAAERALQNGEAPCATSPKDAAAFRLFAALLALASAGTQAGEDDRTRLLSIAARMATA